MRGSSIRDNMRGSSIRDNMSQDVGGSSSSGSPQFSQLQVTISSAKLQNSGRMFSSKADAYLALSIDGQPPRKTEIVRKSSSPTWNEHFTVLVTPYSKLDFRVLNHHQFKTDAVLGYVTLDLNSLLHKHDGRFTNTSLTLDLKGDVKGAAQRTGELTISLNGMDVKMDQFPPKLSNGIRNGQRSMSHSTSSGSVQAGTSSGTPQGGVRTRANSNSMSSLTPGATSLRAALRPLPPGGSSDPSTSSSPPPRDQPKWCHQQWGECSTGAATQKGI
ncbi:E3 ubiquitin-protein ligase Su(dx) [Lamellibrachia satsuma]|nr:E3 ubiquitin-protein ligase Su(dx) [Lamellibrachia satsuma]